MAALATSPRILFCSEHCLCDSASGAAVSATELFMLLRERGWDTAALCGTKMDGPNHPPVGEVVRRWGEVDDKDKLAVHHIDWRGTPARIVRSGELAGSDRDVGLASLPLLLDRELRERRPDVILAYGGGWCGRAILKTARKHGVPVVFWLRNVYYERHDLFDDCAGVIVPSSFTARHYQQKLGLSCEVLFSVVLPERVRCPVRQPRYLTFVSPMPEKGVFFFARLASELARVRPDIEILVVEGRGRADWLTRTGLDVTGCPSVRLMPRTEDPRQFLAVTRVLCFPSLWPETFGRTAVEAMLSGIPVIGSDRGGIPEVIGTGGIVLPIASRLTHDRPMLATVGEVGPWLNEIIRLWDDEAHYRELSRRATSSAARFDPNVIADRADELLRQWSRASRPALPDLDPLAASTFPRGAARAHTTWEGLLTDGESLIAP